ncbi:MAG: glycosyltransferase family 4 protein [Bacteroidia bacterium]|nr:glycosyltransferase family 4 protein [Bacteroidia bacterium]
MSNAKSKHTSARSIALFNASIFWGGGEKWHYSTAIALKDLGYNIHFIGNKEGVLHQKLKDQTDISYHPVSLGKFDFLNPLKLSAFQKLFSRISPDALIMNGSAEMKMGALAGSHASIPQLIYRRGLDAPIKTSLINQYLLRQKLTGIIANSEATKLKLLGHPPIVNPQKVQVIHNGLELAPFLEIQEKTLDPDRIIVGTSGRLVPQKGTELLIELALLLNNENLPFEIRVAGTGPLESQLKKQVVRLGLQNKIHFLGFVEDMPSFYRDLDLFVLPSLWEGFGFVLAEAMASGKAVIAFNTSSNPELIQDGYNGFLVPPGDLQSMKNSILMLLNQPNLHHQLGINGRIHAQKFNMENAINSLLTYLKFV